MGAWSRTEFGKCKGHAPELAGLAALLPVGGLDLPEGLRHMALDLPAGSRQEFVGFPNCIPSVRPASWLSISLWTPSQAAEGFSWLQLQAVQHASQSRGTCRRWNCWRQSTGPRMWRLAILSASSTILQTRHSTWVAPVALHDEAECGELTGAVADKGAVTVHAARRPVELALRVRREQHSSADEATERRLQQHAERARLRLLLCLSHREFKFYLRPRPQSTGGGFLAKRFAAASAEACTHACCNSQHACTTSTHACFISSCNASQAIRAPAAAVSDSG